MIVSGMGRRLFRKQRSPFLCQNIPLPIPAFSDSPDNGFSRIAAKILDSGFHGRHGWEKLLFPISVIREIRGLIPSIAVSAPRLFCSRPSITDVAPRCFFVRVT
jgi:hypothetical protein